MLAQFSYVLANEINGTKFWHKLSHTHNYFNYCTLLKKLRAYNLLNKITDENSILAVQNP